jgi:predicted nicotinamide N-methyase
VVWKITPLIASWLSSPSNILSKYNILNPEATVLELGCGISGIIGLALGPQVQSYVLTDQSYVMKLLLDNLEKNARRSSKPSKQKPKSTKPGRKGRSEDATSHDFNPIAKVLDWEEDQVSSTLVGVEEKSSFDLVIACDCIYNDALIAPLVRTCIDTCNLRSSSGEEGPTLVLVAQQLRSAEVFEGWMREFCSYFRAWRLPDEELLEGLRSNSGFVVHVGVLR